MSNYREHILFGFIFNIPIFLLFLQFGTTVNIIASIIVIFIYSQLPDIDTRASKIRWFLTVVCSMSAFISLVILKNESFAIISTGMLVIIWLFGSIKGFQHRGLTHSILFAILLSLPLLLYSKYIAVMGCVAYISHIILDRKHKQKRKVYKR